MSSDVAWRRHLWDSHRADRILKYRGIEMRLRVKFAASSHYCLPGSSRKSVKAKGRRIVRNQLKTALRKECQSL